MESRDGLTSISPHFYRQKYFLGRSFRYSIPGGFGDISIVRTLSPKHAVIVGYREMTGAITSEIILRNPRGSWSSSSVWEGINIPALRLNYAYTLLDNKKENPSSLSVNLGLIFCFSARHKPFDNGNWGGGSGYLDSSGNVVITDYIDVQRTGISRPNYPVPYLNAGIDGGLRLGRRFKLGLEFTGYLGSRTLYIQYNKGYTNDATFTYEVWLKPYFFSGGIYLQYRIK